MKRLFSLLFAVLVLVLNVISASARTVDLTPLGKTIVQNGDWNYEKINNDTQWELDEYLGESEEVIVPRFYGDLLIVQIGDYCFANNSTVKRVITSSPLWTVGEYAFANCTSLEYFECNYALNTIKTGAFSGASALKNINLEASIVSEISPFAFMNSGLEEVHLPETCTKLGGYSFAQCYQLNKITIPKSVTSIHDDAFKSSDNVVIYCYTDSYAHEYAQAHSIPFVLLDVPVEVTFILGDADNSGYVDIVDSTFIQRYSTGFVVPYPLDVLMQGDVDGDDNLTAVDATFVMRHLIHMFVPYDIGETVTRVIYVPAQV